MSPTTGQKIPAMTLHIKDEDGIDSFDTAAFFAGKKVLMFSVPGAFTPTCSVKHVPSYLEHYDALKQAGFDAIVCLSVNDAHVMHAWGLDQQVGDKIIMLADQSAAFSQELGLAVHMGDIIGTRAARSALVIEDGVITHSFVEEPAVYEVSSAEHVLANI